MKKTIKKQNPMLMHGVIAIAVFMFSALILNVLSVGKDLMKPSSISAATTDGIGVLSDSNSDEYRADDNRGGTYSATTLNWVELLVSKRGLNFGPWGTWGEPRRTGYEYNWSRSGATTHDAVTNGQLSGLTAQVTSGQVKSILIHIGLNDFHSWNGTYQAIYDGTLSGAALQAKIDGMVQDMTTAVDTLKVAGATKIVITNIADPGNSVDFMTKFPDATKRQLVSAAISNVNNAISALATSRSITFVDLAAYGTSLLSQVDAQGFLHIGGELIDLKTRGDEPHHMQLGDSVGHVGTVANGLFGNFIFVNPMNSAYQLGVAPFTESEMLINAGIGLSTPTIAPTAIPTPTPSPTPIVQVYNPSSYILNTGSLIGGNVASLVADDNDYLSFRSNTSGASRTTNVDYGIVPITMVLPKTIKIEARTLSSNSSTTVTMSIYNFSTATWQQIDTYSAGTSETTRTVNLATNLTQYIDSQNRLGVKIVSSRNSTSHTLKVEKLAVTLSK